MPERGRKRVPDHRSCVLKGCKCIESNTNMIHHSHYLHQLCVSCLAGLLFCLLQEELSGAGVVLVSHSMLDAEWQDLEQAKQDNQTSTKAQKPIKQGRKMNNVYNDNKRRAKCLSKMALRMQKCTLLLPMHEQFQYRQQSWSFTLLKKKGIYPFYFDVSFWISLSLSCPPSLFI